MTKLNVLLLAAAAGPILLAQEAPPADAANAPAAPTDAPAYTPPTASQNFHAYLRRTFGLASVLEAGARGGIDEARSAPSEWPQGAEGYFERFGSAYGSIAVRGSTEFALGTLFRENLRLRPRYGRHNVFQAALEDTFTARKGADGHTVFSFARLLGPLSAGLVESSWKPGGFAHRNAAREVGLNYGFAFGRNVVREIFRH